MGGHRPQVAGPHGDTCSQTRHSTPCASPALSYERVLVTTMARGKVIWGQKGKDTSVRHAAGKDDLG